MFWEERKQNEKLLKGETLLFNKNISKQLNIALVFPNSYKLGMSYLGLHHIYYILNSRGDVNCERFFFEKEDRYHLSIETQSELSKFQILLFTVPYLEDVKNIEKMLKDAGLQILNSQRKSTFPILIAGGPGIMINPDKFTKIMDFLVFGDAEKPLSDFIKWLKNEKINSRQDLLRLKSKSIIYTQTYTDFPDTEKFYWENKKNKSICSVILTENTVFSNMFLVQINRSCPYSCVFCPVPEIYGKPLNFSYKKIINSIKSVLFYTKKIGLVSSSVLTHPDFDNIIEFCLNKGITLSVSSVRIDRVTSELISKFKKLNMKQITYAIESGTEKLRYRIGKRFSNELILEKLKMTVANGIKNIKLYFIIGLPYETDEDIEKTVELLKSINDELRKQREPFRITLSVNPFYPLPLTPLSDEKMSEKSVIRRRKKIIRSQPFSITFGTTDIFF